MANEIGTTLLNSLTNSKFDIGNMAKVLADSSVAGPIAILDAKELKTNTELGALTYIESNVQAFQSYLADLSSPQIFQSRDVTSTDKSVVSVQADGAAATGSYRIESKQLAQAHTLVANKTYSSASDAISTGTLSISVGGQTKNIVIDASNNTLEGLQSIVNNGDYGVNAAIVNNGGQYQIMFSSKNTGAASEIALSGLSDFDVAGLTTTSEAQDALMAINGLNISNNTNDFNDVIEGLNIQLKSVSATTQNIGVSSDTQKIVDTVSSFVDVYNQLDTIFDDVGSYKPLTPAQEDSQDFDFFGDLAGSSLLRGLKDQVRSALGGAISQLSDPNTLAAAGIEFDKTGQLTVDTAKLENLATNDLDALGSLFAKGGSSGDPLVNVIGGSDETQAGTYAIDVTQLAERATVAGGAVTYALNEYRASSDRVLDPLASLTVAAGAGLQVSINGPNGADSVSVNLTAGDYATKDAVAAQMQSDINAALSGIPTASSVSVGYDSSQSRYEMTTADGTIDLTSIVGMSNQGFSATSSYAGEQLIDLPTAASFDVSIDASTTASASVATGKYTLQELSEKLQNNINGLSEVVAAGAQVNVSTAGGVLGITSDRFGVASDVTLSNFAGLGNSGLTANLTDAGQNLDGTITTAAGTLSIGAYVDGEDGRKVNVSDFAIIGTEPAAVRGLEFEVLGGVTGARGNVIFSQGFASRLDETIQRLFEDENGLVTQRIESLNAKTDGYGEKRETLDTRYDKLLLKYQIQFSSLQSLLSSTKGTSDFLTANFSNNSNN
jgi:flagellar hook-associated protein 2